MRRLMRMLAILTVAAALVPFAPPVTNALAQNAASPTTRDGHKDFDFLFGTWRTHYRLLKRRLSNNHEWYDCYGTSMIRPFWGGFANLEDGDLWCQGSHIVGMTVRLYDARTHLWSLWWGTKKRGLVPPPQVGHFDGRGVGEFYAHDKHEGKPIIVRFKWRLLPGDHPYFEQAFSPDDGKTWETNWTTVYTRAG